MIGKNKGGDNIEHWKVCIKEFLRSLAVLAVIACAVYPVALIVSPFIYDAFNNFCSLLPLRTGNREAGFLVITIVCTAICVLHTSLFGKTSRKWKNELQEKWEEIKQIAILIKAETYILPNWLSIAIVLIGFCIFYDWFVTALFGSKMDPDMVQKMGLSLVVMSGIVLYYDVFYRKT